MSKKSVIVENNKKINKIVHAQTVMMQSELDLLKVKSGAKGTSDAVKAAVDFYLEAKK